MFKEGLLHIRFLTRYESLKIVRRTTLYAVSKDITYHGRVYENATVIRKHILYASRRVSNGANTTLRVRAIGIV